MQRKLRRYENHLVVIGGGIATLGVWNIIKTFIAMIVNKEYMEALLDENAHAYSDPQLYQVVFIIIFAILSLAILGVYFFIGFSARAEGLGKHSGIFYLVLTAAAVIVSVKALQVNISDFDRYFTSVFDGAVAVLIECTTVVTMCELIYSSVMVKLLRRRIKQQEAT